MMQMCEMCCDKVENLRYFQLSGMRNSDAKAVTQRVYIY